MRVRVLGALLLLIAVPFAARAAAVLSGEYKLPATLDSEVSTDLKTEEWAVVWRPAAAGRYPLLVFLHGNHGTCGHFDATHGVRIDDSTDYTFDGTCPDGYVVTPNHRGYDYLAKAMAAQGYVVVSVNANRGINGASGGDGDWGLNLTRGRLVLRHLQYLAQWNAQGGAPQSLGFDLKDQLDFSQVGLMGHSRGGEGMRAAVAQYGDNGSPWPARIGKVNFRALFEIGPVDGQSNRVLDNTGLAWNVLLPGCDGDVSDLEGMMPYDRGLQITTERKKLNKSTIEVFGANHNFYNTEWQVTDTTGCEGETPLFGFYKGSKTQRLTARGTLVPFFLAHVGRHARPQKAQIFDPSYPLPARLTSVTAYARGFTPSPRASGNFIVDNFDKATGTSSESVPDQSQGLNQYSHGSASFSDDVTQRAAAVSWSQKGGFLQTNATASGTAADISGYSALEFRVALRCSGTLCSLPSDPTGDVDFSIALADKDGDLSAPVTLKSLAAIYRPVGAGGTNTIFASVRVPLAAFAGFDPSKFHGVRFSFDKTQSASVYFADVRFTVTPAGPGGLSGIAFTGLAARRAGAAIAMAGTGRITAIRRGASAVEVQVAADQRFPVTDAFPRLAIGAQRFDHARIERSGALTFVLAPQAFAAARNGETVSLGIGAQRWTLGKLVK